MSKQHNNPKKHIDDQINAPNNKNQRDETKIFNAFDKKETEKKHAQYEQAKSELKRKKKLEKKLHRRQVWSFVFVVCIVLNIVVATIGAVIGKRMISDMPDIDIKDFRMEESSMIYDANGKLVTEVGVYLRENITYDQCPESLVDAFLSIEDSRFFTHFGFDIPRFTKAALSNLKNRNFAQGGSTFTMQLVKNTYFTVDAGDQSKERKRSIDYKVQQIALAIELEQMLNKKEIFQLYMNRLNFGGRIRGVQRASLYYFGKDCDELTLPESAMLAGIINLPNRYNPKAYLDYGTKRRNEVLDLMHHHGYITDEELKLSKAVKVEDLLIGDTRKASDGSKYQSYIDAVLEEATALTGFDPNIRGMQIHTHLVPEIQQEIEDIQNSKTNVRFPDDIMQVAMISMNAKNGGIVGIGGGRNYDGARLLNRATMNFKQPGSSVKPVLSYALAFEYLGYTLDEILVDRPVTYPRESMVLVNATGRYEGDVGIKDALGNSLNIPAILTLGKVEDKIGKEKVVSYMNAIGFNRATNDNFHLSFAIGGTWFETTCKQLAGANAMLVNGGVYNEPHTIEHIEMGDGTMVYPENQNHKILSPGSCWLTLQLMNNNVYGDYFNWQQILRRDYPIYSKTGTSDWGRSGLQYGIPEGAMKDKWMIASSSEFTNCVWVGYDIAIAGKQTYYTNYKAGLNIPGNINKLLLDTEEDYLGEKPKGVEMPNDVEEVQYVYGTYPHVKPEEGMDPSVLITSYASKAGLEASPLVSSEEWRETLNSDNGKNFGISASINGDGQLTVGWGSGNGLCSGDSKNISLHDQWNNDIDMWGRCMVDLNWLAGDQSGSYWATVYCDDEKVADISSTSGFYQDWPADLWGTVKVCGGSSAHPDQVCTIAKYTGPSEENGWWDENGVFHEN